MWLSFVCEWRGREAGIRVERSFRKTLAPAGPAVKTFPFFLNRGSEQVHPKNWHGCGPTGDNLRSRGIGSGLVLRTLARENQLSAPNPHPLPSSVARADEHLLVAAAKSGDTAAFEELVNRYERKIFRLTMNITRNHEDAEDAMQDAFMKAYTHLKTFEEGSRFYTWLVRIAANEALMRL